MNPPKSVLGDPERLGQLLSLCDDLPEVDISGDQHLAFRIRKKSFAYYLDDHHGDGIVSLCAKTIPERQADLISRHPDRYYLPAYLGHQGWVALRLDRAEVAWGEVLALLFGPTASRPLDDTSIRWVKVDVCFAPSKTASSRHSNYGKLSGRESSASIM